MEHFSQPEQQPLTPNEDAFISSDKLPAFLNGKGRLVLQRRLEGARDTGITIPGVSDAMHMELYAAEPDAFTLAMVEAARKMMGIYESKPTPPREQAGGYRTAWKA